jgi:hypothetical protein
MTGTRTFASDVADGSAWQESASREEGLIPSLVHFCTRNKSPWVEPYEDVFGRRNIIPRRTSNSADFVGPFHCIMWVCCWPCKIRPIFKQLKNTIALNLFNAQRPNSSQMDSSAECYLPLIYLHAKYSFRFILLVIPTFLDNFFMHLYIYCLDT